MPWDARPSDYLFHYTYRASMEQIYDTSVFVVGATPHPVHGTGLFATDIRPGELRPDQVLSILFNDERPAAILDGVIVLRRDLTVFTPVEPHQLLWKAEPTREGQPGLSLVGLMLGYGQRGVGREYLFPPWLWLLSN